MVEKNKAVAKVKESQNLVWGNVSSKEISPIVRRVAQIYGIPPMGVTLMGAVPYINKEGRLFLLGEFTEKNPVKSIVTEMLKISTAPTEGAVCKVIITLADGTTVDGFGEAAVGNVKLDAVKKTLNLMAETRALNRAIWKLVAHKSWKQVETNLRNYKVSDEESALALRAGQVSAEEMGSEDEGEDRTSIPELTEKEHDGIGNALNVLNKVKTLKELEAAKEKLKGWKKDWNVKQMKYVIAVFNKVANSVTENASQNL